MINRIVDQAVTRTKQIGPTLSDRMDRVFCSRYFGLPLFFLIMYLMFQAVYKWSGPFMDAIEGIFAWAGETLGAGMADGMLKSLVVDGIIGGLGGVAVFLPQIFIVFLFIALRNRQFSGHGPFYYLSCRHSSGYADCNPVSGNHS